MSIIEDVVTEVFGSENVPYRLLEKYTCLFTDKSQCILYFEDAWNKNLGFGQSLELLTKTASDYEAQKRLVHSQVLQLQDPRVLPVLSKVKKFFRDYKEPNLISAIVVGSFYFGDPSLKPDLDLDLMLKTKTETDIPRAEEIQLSLKLSIGVPITFIYADQVLSMLDTYKKGSFGPVYNHFLLGLDSAEILFSHKYFVDGNGARSTVGALAKRIDSLAHNDTIFRAIMMLQFYSMIKDRSEKVRPARNPQMALPLIYPDSKSICQIFK